MGHGKLKGHVKQRSIFIAKGGKVDDKNASATMRRLSSMYQDQQSEVANALKKAREKAMLQYNRFKLPPIDKAQRSKWSDYSNIDNFNSKNKNFVPPDSKKMMAPKGNTARNNKPMPSQHKKPAINNGYKANTSSPKSKIKIKPKANGGNFPPPPSYPSNNGQAYNQNAQHMQNGQAYNPQNQWQQQQQPNLGYGSSTNLTYQQMQQAQQFNPNRMGAYQMQQQQQQMQRQQYGQPRNQYYKYPQKR